jgi:hypothetical protein
MNPKPFGTMFGDKPNAELPWLAVFIDSRLINPH